MLCKEIWFGDNVVYFFAYFWDRAHFYGKNLANHHKTFTKFQKYAKNTRYYHQSTGNSITSPNEIPLHIISSELVIA